MSKPLIGITTRNGKDADHHPITTVQHSYIRAIVQAGGLPLPIPSLLNEEDFLDMYSRLDGILFTGGGDVSLDYFDGSDHPRIGEVDKMRDLTEITLLRTAVEDGKPMLGICRGAQVMNVALGGTLYTHIHDQVENALDHDYPGNLRTVLVHPVNVDESAKAAGIFGETLLHVNSLHHQGLKDIAPRLRVVGTAPDGLPEVIEMEDHPYAVAVQWHPEWLTDQPSMRRLFKSFVDASSK
ncbi:MAG: gamma-glutamyl-gamma-aminobutyrate hydrolase family protein [Anaerolineales bacterium]|nr:gamma-glutamyl-gamma-aminobutyrate hydrolase family protein [Anaerolineales bacterium]